jgi:plastocyanin
MIMRSWRRPLFAASAGALALAVLGGSPAAAAPHTYTVVLDKMKFGAVPANLHKGDTVIWANRDFIQHSATAADHSFDVNLPPGKAGKTVLTKSGSIPFVCRYHPGMRGVLVVK